MRSHKCSNEQLGTLPCMSAVILKKRYTYITMPMSPLQKPFAAAVAPWYVPVISLKADVSGWKCIAATDPSPCITSLKTCLVCCSNWYYAPTGIVLLRQTSRRRRLRHRWLHYAYSSTVRVPPWSDFNVVVIIRCTLNYNSRVLVGFVVAASSRSNQSIE